MQHLNTGLAQLRAEGLYRSRMIIDGAQDILITMEGKTFLSFCSNDYLGLANHPDVISAFKQAADSYGVGSGASHLVSGHSRAHHALEEELAEFTGRDRALLFSTGYMANMGVVSALVQKDDVVLEDKLNHASLIDAARLPDAKLVRYGHLDMESLSAQLERNREHARLIASDGVFSMDGDIAPLKEMIALKQSAHIMIDDAHGIGVLGKHGAGTLEHFGVTQDQVPILVGTLGKAFGTFGAFVAGSEALIEHLINHARTYIFTTALPAAVAEATRASLKIVKNENYRREKLKSLVKQFRDGASERGLKLADSVTPIQLFIVGDAQRAVNISTALKQKGILVPAIRPPTVPKDSARLRITFSANHEPHHVEQLLDILLGVSVKTGESV